MDEMTRESTSQVLTAILTALGLIVDPIPFLIALVVSVASAVLMSRERRGAKRRPFWSVILGALVCSVVAAMIAAHLFPTLPLVLVMVLAGLSSSFIINIYVGVMTRVEDRAEELVDRAADKFLPRKGPKP